MTLLPLLLAAPAATFVPYAVPPGAKAAYSHEISGDGAVLYGEATIGGETRYYRWVGGKPRRLTVPPGAKELSIVATSTDGSLALGKAKFPCKDDGHKSAYDAHEWGVKWANGVPSLLRDDEVIATRANDIADDGTIVGTSFLPNGIVVPSRWNRVGTRNPQRLPETRVPPRYPEVSRISADGSTVVGDVREDQSSASERHVVWVDTDGKPRIVAPGTLYSPNVCGISATGETILLAGGVTELGASTWSVVLMDRGGKTEFLRPPKGRVRVFRTADLDPTGKVVLADVEIGAKDLQYLWSRAAGWVPVLSRLKPVVPKGDSIGDVHQMTTKNGRVVLVGTTKRGVLFRSEITL